jgi:hypothetical protein
MDGMNGGGTSIYSSGGVKEDGIFQHVFSSTEESKSEILNVIQYAVLGVIPIVLLNKLIQRFSPEADPDSSSIEISIEIMVQIIVMFVGIILIHRIITYIPTYSGFKYENMNLSGSILLFLMILLSIQTKMGLKVNILYDRLVDLWEGNTDSGNGNGNGNGNRKKNMKVLNTGSGGMHSPSQADHLDGGQSGVFPPMMSSTTTSQSLGGHNYMMGGGGGGSGMMETPLLPANSVGNIGSSFW